MKRVEVHFINQLYEHIEELEDCEISDEARKILYKMKSLINHHEFEVMVRKRRQDTNNEVKTTLLKEGEK